MGNGLVVEIPGNIELHLNQYQELMTLIYLVGSENISKSLESILNALMESSCSKVINGQVAERNEILRRLSASFAKLNVVPVVILEEK